MKTYQPEKVRTRKFKRRNHSLGYTPAIVAGLFLIALISLGIHRGHKACLDQKFQDCIEFHPSDAVCDSCWKAVYGKESKY